MLCTSDQSFLLQLGVVYSGMRARSGTYQTRVWIEQLGTEETTVGVLALQEGCVEEERERERARSIRSKIWQHAKHLQQRGCWRHAYLHEKPLVFGVSFR